MQIKRIYCLRRWTAWQALLPRLAFRFQDEDIWRRDGNNWSKCLDPPLMLISIRIRWAEVQAEDPGALHKQGNGLESTAQFYNPNGFDANNHDSEILKAFRCCEEQCCQRWNLCPVCSYSTWPLSTPVFRVWFSIAWHPTWAIVSVHVGRHPYLAVLNIHASALQAYVQMATIKRMFILNQILQMSMIKPQQLSQWFGQFLLPTFLWLPSGY